ncbi:YbcC family protein [Idiomarina xiamenensis]|uniref:Probable inorganic carbon transporter subunit DabA n=1 Tax=Idiomarina xiamenensis 10-D-4 TaxID=740709 RepID=K2JPC3_9GAMM|nr:DUF2309 domain-containing protein [Idiomarina xiamenensis]EKE85346.1 hypothetical protein A10D4_03340 [Idiomarina xiamenensis 10-D-4]
MTASSAVESHPTAELQAAINAACDSIAPNWPLDRMIAVNPYWSWVDKPFTEVAHRLARLAGSPMTMSLAYYQQRWQAGKISPQDLQQALAEAETTQNWQPEQLIAALAGEDIEPIPAPLLCDALDSQRNLRNEPAWCDTITHQVAQFCAAYFDNDQADWHPHSDIGLYQSWRATLAHDHSVALLMKTPQIPALAGQMQVEPLAQIDWVLKQLAIPAEQWPDYLQAVMYRVSGWASWCAYKKWQANLIQQSDDSLLHLLAIRVSWEYLVDDNARHAESTWQRWQQQWQQHFHSYHADATRVRLIWQRAHEISYQRQLNQALSQSAVAATCAKPARVQAAFCIDVRSEVIRRHLEAQSEDIQTIGFAGFFGLPVSYTPIGTQIKRPQLPGLLAPMYSLSDSVGSAQTDASIAQQRRKTLQRQSQWLPFNSMPASNFTLVEALGLGYIGKLIKRVLPLHKQADTAPGLSTTRLAQLRPLLNADLEHKLTLAENALIGLGLVGQFGELVLLVGHGSENANNPQRAGLDCGACCGQSGDVNARALAQLLNDKELRQALSQRDIHIPEQTCFVAARHNTTTDELSVLDSADVPKPMQALLAQLQTTFSAAAAAARAERAPQLGLQAKATAPAALAAAFQRRTHDWAQTRPEWGLANNAAFIIAPRQRSRGIKLDGRVFLHEYQSEQDADGSLLAQIMTAPMIVANWINMQYYASTVDNSRYGSGNKTLHNVVGGRMGVFEGNGGDLRIGLALQSLHDGQRWRHQPLRLTVVIDAPQSVIGKVINEQPIVKQLVDNRWLYVARFEQGQLAFFEGNQWLLPY